MKRIGFHNSQPLEESILHLPVLVVPLKFAILSRGPPLGDYRPAERQASIEQSTNIPFNCSKRQIGKKSRDVEV